MTRKRKFILNTLVSISYKVLTLISAFILPRFILQYYGSAINGLTQSIADFLSFISLIECGITSVIDSNLYGPLAQKDNEKLSAVFVSSEKFFQNIAKIFAIYITLLMILYPLFVDKYFGFWYTSTLILIISISTFTQYYFGISYRILINADQLGYISTIIQGIVVILNTICSVFLITIGASIHLTKLITSVLYIAQPIALKIIVDRKYKIDHKVLFTGEPIKQKWNGIAQHIAFVIATKADTIVLTIFSTLENVSIYGIYNLVLSGVTSIFDALYVGINPLIGNMLVKNEKEKLNSLFSSYEWITHYLVTLLFSITSVLIVPFILIYTSGISDANYSAPIFAKLITLAIGMRILRTPYQSVVLTAGHFRQTQRSSIIEAVINVSLSAVVVLKLGLVGVAVGTLVAMTYRTLYLVYYLSKNILLRNINIFFKLICVDILCAAVMLFTANLYNMNVSTYVEWFFLALKIGFCCFIEMSVIQVFFFYKEAKQFILNFRRK